MAQAPVTVAREAAMQYLVDNWNRTALATYAQGVTIPDPGHGLDDICPIAAWGLPFDPTKDEDVDRISNFKAFQLQDNGSQEGTGWLLCQVVMESDPITETPGLRPEMRMEVTLNILIATPKASGQALAELYAGALAMIFRRVTFSPQVDGVDYVRNLGTPNEVPVFDTEDESWTFFRMEIPLSMIYRLAGAGQQ